MIRDAEREAGAQPLDAPSASSLHPGAHSPDAASGRGLADAKGNLYTKMLTTLANMLEKGNRP